MGFYGNPESCRRMEGYNLLRQLNGVIGISWLCARDFNDVLSLDELDGLQPRPNWQMRNFRDVVDACGFVDLGWHVHKYTWVNNHDSFIQGGAAGQGFHYKIMDGEISFCQCNTCCSTRVRSHAY